MDPLQIFKSKGAGQKPYISEKTIIRPTFSYLGKFTISDTVFRQIMEYLADRMPAIYKVLRTRASNTEAGPRIYMEVMVTYGYNIQDSLKEFKEKAIREIENLTSMNVVTMDVVAKSVYIPEKEEGTQNE